jgi:hypothetical protein
MWVFLFFLSPLICAIFDGFAWFFIGHPVLIDWDTTKAYFVMISTVIGLSLCDGMN